ncbi:L-lactate dehydrogenase 1 [Halalkalibacter krulwichiae]|uniref:L-lactate dehydrogenase 1 n=2 Tax=Halalkalibacter krulwichiae TaxID=199441 RepID=A0A1X9MKS3_9BACI|nr:L-lactate dehydrogenase 1 [Halalkalibacter krulwichiae]
MTLAMNELADELCLIDVNETFLDNHVMDFENAFPHKRMYRGSYPDLKDSSIVIITAGVPNRSDVKSRNAYLQENISIFRKIGQVIETYVPNAIIVTASNPVDLLNYYLYKAFDFQREQLIGYSLNDSYRFEWALRSTLGIEAKEHVVSPVIGEHGGSQVPLFSHVRKSGEQLSVTPQQEEQIRAELKTWFVRFNELNVPRTTGWTTGVGMSKLVAKLSKDEPMETIGSAIVSGHYGLDDMSFGVPIKVNRNGIQQIIEWDLSDQETKALTQSAKTIQAMIVENKAYFL